MRNPIKVWDLPTRLFHWALVGLFLSGWLSFKFGDANMVWHRWNGYAVLTLVLFRLLWGVVGSQTSRFSSFLTTPWRAGQYLLDLLRGRDLGHPHIGHNPAGGWMVVALLLGLMLLAGHGLFASDDIMVEGPLAYRLSSGGVKLATMIHKQLFWILSGMVVLHIAAVMFHRFVKGEFLVKAMVTGCMMFDHDRHPRLAPLWLAVLCAVLAAGMVAGILYQRP